MKVHTEYDCIGEIKDREGFTTLGYSDGTSSRFPHNFVFSLGEGIGEFYTGKCSGFGFGSSIRFYDKEQKLHVGRYVSAGGNTKFMISGFHETSTISTCEFGYFNKNISHVHQRKYDKIFIKNDVWIGDDCLIMGGTVIENGCVIGARSVLPCNFKTEPFGVYAGVPAKLKKFRFPEEIRKALLELEWWEMSFSWTKENNNYFLHDLTLPSGIDVLNELKNKKQEYFDQKNEMRKSIEGLYKLSCEDRSDANISGHIPRLYELAKECEHITEMGTRNGISTAAFLYAKPKKLICYDIVEKPEVKELANVAGDTEFVFHNKSTLEVEIEQTDLLFIDTWHVYAQLKTELELHSGKVNKYIVMHDTTGNAFLGEDLDNTHGLWPAIEEFLQKGTFEIHAKYDDSAGLTILKRKC